MEEVLKEEEHDLYGGGFDLKLKIKSYHGWKSTCHGDAYTTITLATLFKNLPGDDDFIGIGTRLVFKHVNDEENYEFARRLVVSKLFADKRVTMYLSKDTRKRFWDLINKK